jgi:hypothetical protein
VNPDPGTPAVPPDDAAARAHDDHAAGRRDVPKPPRTANNGEPLGTRDVAERPGTADDDPPRPAEQDRPPCPSDKDGTPWAQADGAWSHGAIHDDDPTGATECMMAAMRLATGRRRDEPDPDRHHRDPWGRSVHELHGTPSAQSTKRNLKPCAFSRLPVFDERKIGTE